MRNRLGWTAIVIATAAAFAFFWSKGMLGTPVLHDQARQIRKSAGPPPEGCQLATFGAGCFWCTEAVFQQLDGVYSVVSGYSGGAEKDPSYTQVCKGATGHAEVIQISFDPKVISFAELLEVFWKTHDPTTLNRQGNDLGPQYRSVIFYHNEVQKELAARYKTKLDTAGAFAAPIVTEITPFSEFFPAEKYHQNYYLDNPRQPYCSRLIRPKLDKFEEAFKDKLRTPAP